ncbi:MAG: Type I restriction modification DNA specificity domain protein [bacterium ADurb.Bin243]|nr:MAG: Type I restriction modification DNA specificity domain protein [bacterium ADurb.Bin243]HOD41820.1 restriction endonuclease subunit S [Candidatus Wallbacteria bacterium]
MSFTFLIKCLIISKKIGSPQINDILITAVGIVGAPYLVRDEEFYFKDGNLLWFRNFHDDVYSQYLIYYFLSNQFKSFLAKLAKGSSQLALTIEKLEQISILLPSLALQKSIVNKLDLLSEETQNLESIYRQKIAALDELKKSLCRKRSRVSYERKDQSNHIL